MPKRRPQLSPTLITRVARLIFNGFDNEELCLMTGLNEKVIRALRKGNEFPEVRIACLAMKDNAIEKIKAAKGKINGLQWFMERRWPRQFAKADTQLTLAAGPVTNNTLVVSAEVAETLVKRSKAALDEINQLIVDKAPGDANDAY